MAGSASWESATGRLERATALVASHIPVQGNAQLLADLLASRQAAIDEITALDPALCTPAIFERIRAAIHDGDVAAARARIWRADIDASLNRAALLQAALTAQTAQAAHTLDCQG